MNSPSSSHPPDAVALIRPWRDYLLQFLIAAAVFLVYANSLHNPFVWDHEVVIVENPIIRSLRNIPLAFQYDLFGKPLTSTGYYRPLGVLTYMLDFHFWELNPLGYHITSIFLHALTAVLFFHFLRRIGVPTAANFLACIFFAVHPANTETVTYLFREDSLAAIFSLGCFLCYLNTREKSARWAAPAVASFALALLSKESAVMLPFILGVEAWLNHRANVSRNVSAQNRAPRYLLLALLVLAAVYIGGRLFLLSASNEASLSTIRAATHWERLLTLPRIVLTYLGLLVFPVNLHMEYLFVTKSAGHPSVWLGVPALLLLAGAFAWLLSRFPPEERPERDRLILFAAWFVLGLAPFTQVLAPLHSTLLEHWVYFPGMAFLAIAASLGQRLFDKYENPFLRSGLILLAAGLFAHDVRTSVLRNRDWSDPMRLYQHDVALEPRSFLLHNNLGVMYFRQGRLAEAKEAFLRAIRESPGAKYDVAYNNVGVIYENEGRMDAAESAFRQSILLNNYELAYINLARVYLRTNRIAEARSVAEEGAARYPLNVEIRYYLAATYFIDKDYARAKPLFEAVQKMHPGFQKTTDYLRELDRILAPPR